VFTEIDTTSQPALPYRLLYNKNTKEEEIGKRRERSVLQLPC
jgi:hypothetical protein